MKASRLRALQSPCILLTALISTCFSTTASAFSIDINLIPPCGPNNGGGAGNTCSLQCVAGRRWL